MLFHDAQHGNSLAIYRNGQLVKVLKVDSLAIEAFLKSKFIAEVKKQPAKKETKAPALPPDTPSRTSSTTPSTTSATPRLRRRTWTPSPGSMTN